MNPCLDAWKAAVCAASVLTAVERRLVDAGALTELRQLHGLSAQEQDLLVYREVHEPGWPSGRPQTTRGTVAA